MVGDIRDEPADGEMAERSKKEVPKDPRFNVRTKRPVFLSFSNDVFDHAVVLLKDFNTG